MFEADGEPEAPALNQPEVNVPEANDDEPDLMQHAEDMANIMADEDDDWEEIDESDTDSLGSNDPEEAAEARELIRDHQRRHRNDRALQPNAEDDWAAWNDDAPLERLLGLEGTIFNLIENFMWVQLLVSAMIGLLLYIPSEVGRLLNMAVGHHTSFTMWIVHGYLLMLSCVLVYMLSTRYFRPQQRFHAMLYNLMAFVLSYVKVSSCRCIRVTKFT